MDGTGAATMAAAVAKKTAAATPSERIDGSQHRNLSHGASDQNRSTSMIAWAKACGASCGRLCPMPPLIVLCSYLPENLLA